MKLSDLAVVVTAVAALITFMRPGERRRLRAGRVVWIAALAWLGWIVAATFYPLASTRSYAWKTHLVTAGEFGEYALLAPAVPLLLRRGTEVLLAFGTLLAWSAIATVVGIVQWEGWRGLAGWGPGRRQPAFLGPHDFAALSGMTLGIGLVLLLWRPAVSAARWTAWFAVVVGGVGFILGGASAGILGLAPAVLVAVAIAHRRLILRRQTLAIVTAVALAASLGVVALRAGDFGQFFRFLGVKSPQAKTARNVQTYSQRTVLAYIGARIWLHHPILGVGWQGSSEPSAFEAELSAARRHFPHVAPRAFPSSQRRYGVQLFYLQTLADLGIFGFSLLVALIVAVLVVGVRVALRAPPSAAFVIAVGVFWFLLALGLWAAEGIVAGIPLDALTWLAVGFACRGQASIEGPERLLAIKALLADS